VNKGQLVERIARDAELTLAGGERALAAFIAALKASLCRGEPVTIAGFGSFYVVVRRARSGRDPRGRPVTVPAARLPRFRASRAFKDALN